MTANDTDHPVRPLHLSDIHFRAGTAWDADPVLRPLTGFVRREAGAGLAPLLNDDDACDLVPSVGYRPQMRPR